MLNLVSGYWQVPLHADAHEMSPFATHTGQGTWKVLLFGLILALSTFQRVMKVVLRSLYWKSLFLYIDEIIVIGQDFYSHIWKLEKF